MAVTIEVYDDDNHMETINISPDKSIEDIIKSLVCWAETNDYLEEERWCTKCGTTSGLIEDEDMCYNCANQRGRI